jgi:uncharacterized coiled-coil protein SlyX
MEEDKMRKKNNWEQLVFVLVGEGRSNNISYQEMINEVKNLHTKIECDKQVIEVLNNAFIAQRTKIEKWEHYNNLNLRVLRHYKDEVDKLTEELENLKRS